MEVFRFASFKLTPLLVIGIVMGSNLDMAPNLALACTLLSLTGLGFFFYYPKKRNPMFFGVFVAFTTCGIGATAYTLWQPKNQPYHYSRQMTGTETVWRLKIREVLKPTTFQQRYIALVNGRDGHVATGKIILNLPLDTTRKKLRVDDELITLGTLEEIRSPLNPHQFDYRKYLQRLGIFHQLNGSHDSYMLSSTTKTTIFGHAAAIRHTLVSQLRQTRMGDAELAIVQALLLGQRHAISTETYNDYKDAGAVHILAVSGLHVGILLLVLQVLLRPLERLPKGKTCKLISVITLLWCFAILAGLSASIVRAVTMFSFVGYAQYLNRPSNTFNILALSMFFILLLFNPMLLFQVGFQMSYAAVFFIVWIYPMLQRLWTPKNRIMRMIWQLLSVSIAAQIGVVPISLFYFHQFPGLFFVANLLVVPFLGILLVLGIVVLLLAGINALPDLLAEGYADMIGMMNGVIGWVAAQEDFVFRNIPFDVTQLVLSYLLIVTLLLFFTKSLFWRLAAFLLVIVGFQFWLLHTSLYVRKRQEVMVIHQNKNSIILHQNGARLTTYARNIGDVYSVVNNIIVARRIEEQACQPLRNAYDINNKRLVIVDSTGIVPRGERIEYLVLTQSPKINLERMIDSLRPRHIIADGSNYKSSVARWKKTCAKRKLPFHYTGEKGAYYIQ